MLKALYLLLNTQVRPPTSQTGPVRPDRRALHANQLALQMQEARQSLPAVSVVPATTSVGPRAAPQVSRLQDDVQGPGPRNIDPNAVSRSEAVSFTNLTYMC